MGNGPRGDCSWVEHCRRKHGSEANVASWLGEWKVRTAEESRRNGKGSMALPQMTTEEDPKPVMQPIAVTAIAREPGAVVQMPGDGGISAIRRHLTERGSGAVADRIFMGLMLACALSIFAIVLFILTVLVIRSKLSLAQFGFGFFVSSAWDPVSGDFGALPFIFGTLMTSFLALAMAVPLALGVAIFLSELCPE